MHLLGEALPSSYSPCRISVRTHGPTLRGNREVSDQDIGGRVRGKLGPSESRASPGNDPFTIGTNSSAYKKHQKCCHCHPHPRLRWVGNCVSQSLSPYPSLSLSPPGTHPRWPKGTARKLREDTFTSGLQSFGASETGQDKASSPLEPGA